MVAVSIVGYHSSPEHLRWACRSLADQSQLPGLVLVHLNAADVAEAEAVRSLLADVPVPTEITSSAENRGFSGAHNAALAQAFDAGHSAVVVHNPDLALAPDALSALESASRALPRALLGPMLELADPTDLAATGRIDTVGIRWTRGGRHLDDRQGEPLVALGPDPVLVGGISGACLHVSRTAYDAILTASGEFFDHDFIAYREDAELAHRAALLDIPSYLVPTARGLHVRRLRGTSRGDDPDIDRLGVRNRFLIAAKYGARRPGGLVSPWLRDAVVVGGVLVRERHSLTGLSEAWHLRAKMRAKGAKVRAATAPRK